jgi:hypothetical protein
MTPMLGLGVNDLPNELTRREVMQEIARLERSLPQLGFSVVLTAAPREIGLSLDALWLFNRTGIANAVERGGANRQVLLVVDSDMGHAACMAGYGLEPFLGEELIHNALNAFSTALAAGQLSPGILHLLAEMECLLIDCAESLENAFGIGPFEFQGLAHLIESEQESAVVY